MSGTKEDGGSWRDSVKIGDAVIVDGTRERVAVVDKVTPTQIVIGSMRYRKRDGCSAGTSAWSHEFIREGTPDRVAHIRAQSKTRALLNEVRGMVSAVKVDQLSLEQLQQIKFILKGATVDQSTLTP